jgi:hypothetical protein
VAPGKVVGSGAHRVEQSTVGWHSVDEELPQWLSTALRCSCNAVIRRGRWATRRGQEKGEGTRGGGRHLEQWRAAAVESIPFRMAQLQCQ